MEEILICLEFRQNLQGIEFSTTLGAGDVTEGFTVEDRKERRSPTDFQVGVVRGPRWRVHLGIGG